MKFFSKLGIFDLNERFSLDLSPLEKLYYIEELQLSGSAIRSIEPLAGIKNLRKLQILGSPVSDIEPLKDLINLEEIDLYGAQITDISPLKNLTKLRRLNIVSCNNITDEQVIKLKKALPALIISR